MFLASREFQIYIRIDDGKTLEREGLNIYPVRLISSGNEKFK